MATLRPFRALRPRPADAAQISAVPYDVVTTDEARALADGNALSFLRVSRAEIELPNGTDPYAPDVYARAAANFDRLKRSALVLEAEPSVYLYRLTVGDHAQTGVAATFSIDEYDRDLIKKHERTRRDKEDDRTRHLIALGAQTGPVFLTYRASDNVRRLTAEAAAREPLFDFEAPDAVRHTIWRAAADLSQALAAAFINVPALYIADGHHRAASAARARTALHGGGDSSTMLAVAFPHDEVRILPYNRVVRDLGDMSSEVFLAAVLDRFEIEPGPAVPVRAGHIAMYFRGRWQTLRARVPPLETDPIRRLDVSVLQDQLLGPVLQVLDVRTDKRIDFVGGARGTAALEQRVQSGQAALAFSVYPVTVDDLMRVSDAGAIMPPKSTWFEPKLRDGLLIHPV